VPTVVDSDELFTIVEASCLLGISRATVRAAVVRGDLDPVVTPDGSRRITRNSVLRYGGR
jgi:predicted site-specific integrase-resolvase